MYMSYILPYYHLKYQYVIHMYRSYILPYYHLQYWSVIHHVFTYFIEACRTIYSGNQVLATSGETLPHSIEKTKTKHKQTNRTKQKDKREIHFIKSWPKLNFSKTFVMNTKLSLSNALWKSKHNMTPFFLDSSDWVIHNILYKSCIATDEALFYICCLISVDDIWYKFL